MSDFDDFDGIDDEPIRRRPREDSGARTIITVVWLVATLAIIFFAISSLGRALGMIDAHKKIQEGPAEWLRVSHSMDEHDFRVVLQGPQSIYTHCAVSFGLSFLFVAVVAIILSAVANFMMKDKRSCKRAWG